MLESLGFLAICWGLVQATKHSFESVAVSLPIAGGLIFVGLFALWEGKTANPMLPLTIFRNTRFNVANAVSFSIYGSLCGAVFLTSQYFQVAQHLDPLQAAVRFVPWPLPTILVAPLAGSLAARYGNRRFMAAGMAIQAIALALFAAVVDSHTPYIELCAPLVLSGIGIGLVFPAMSGEVVSSVRPAQMGIASGANATIRELGGVFGVALVALVFSSRMVYARPDAFVTGYVHALWACVAFTVCGAVVAACGLRIPTRSAEIAQPEPAALVPA